MNKKLQIGLIGAGGIVQGAHLNPGWLAVPDCEVVAVCDVNPIAAQKLADKFKIPHVFNNYQDLVKMKQLDAVDICTPNKLHTPMVIAALKAGKHVMCEKPLATTTKEVLQMQAAAKKAGKILMTAQHCRFGEHSQAIKAWIDTGALGEVYHARVNATRRNHLPISPGFINPELSGGGPCLDIGVHALDTAMWMMGFPRPVRVSGRALTNFAKGHEIPGAWGEWDRKMYGVEDFASGYIHFENGATMALEASWLQHQEKEDWNAVLLGKKASVKWPTGEFYTAVNRALVDGKILPKPGCQPAHTEEILAFAKAIREELPSPVPVEQTLYVIAILEGIMNSSATNKEIVLPKYPKA